MRLKKSSKSTQEKIALFGSFFSGLKEVYGTYDPGSGRSRQIKAPVTEKVFLAHLSGHRPYGVYLLIGDRTRAIVADFDSIDQSIPWKFVARAKHYGVFSHIERSKSKGFHAWIFFEESGVNAFKARLVVQHILEEIGQPQTEIFPKQDKLGNGTSYGNFINAALFGSLVQEGKTVFVEPETFRPYADQWHFLESVSRMNEEILNQVIELNDLTHKQAIESSEHHFSKKPEEDTFGLPPCAIKMFRDGVSEFQRVGCFRLGVHLKRLGLPYDMAVAALKTWALKNRPLNKKRVIRDKEILSQVSYAYDHAYSGYGCESPAIKPFCETTCAVWEWKKEKFHS